MQIFAGHAAGLLPQKNHSKTRYPLFQIDIDIGFHVMVEVTDVTNLLFHPFVSLFLSMHKTRCLLWMLGAWWQGLLDARMQHCTPIAISNALEVVVTGSEDHGIIVWQPEIFINTTVKF